MRKIGVSACFMYPDVNRIVFGRKTLCYLERDMARYLARPDVQPILIPDLEGETLNAFLRQLDGLVLQGGSDIAPQSYGAKPILDNSWPGDPARDAYELKLIQYFLDHGKPIYGICRGMQLLNVFFGGTLYQDLRTERPESIIHRDGHAYDQIHHGIVFPERTYLAELHKDDSHQHVNTVHHQALRDVAQELEILANCAEDGLVEAVQWRRAPAGCVIGVQWHPEFFWNAHEPLIDPHRIYDAWLSFL